MEALQEFLISVSLLPSPVGTRLWIKLRNISFGISIFTILLAAFVSSGVFFIKFVDKDLKNSLYALLQIAAFACGTYTIVVGYNKRHELGELFPEFRAIREKCIQMTEALNV